MEARILYDTTVGGIRAVKLDMDGFQAAFTCNSQLGHCTVRIEPLLPMAPDIAWAGDQLAMTYHHVTVTLEGASAFEESYRKAKQFCASAGTYIRNVMAQIERGDALDV